MDRIYYQTIRSLLINVNISILNAGMEKVLVEKQEEIENLIREKEGKL